jgi:hypothetical protein
MSTAQKVNFEPVTDVMSTHRRDFPLAVPTLADPLNAIALVDGEWMVIDSSYKIARAADIATLGTAGAGGRATTMAWPLWAERGRTDVLSLSQRKMPVLFLGQYEFDTRVFDATAVVASGAAITTVLQPLKVATLASALITGSSRNFVGLVGHGGTGDAAPVAGYVTRLPASNGGKLRFINALPGSKSY